MKMIAIIQARMGSSRFPQKIMRPLKGVSMLERIIRRALLCKNLDEVWVATTIEPEDEKTIQLCQKLQIPYYRGSVDDVLDRFIQTGRAAKAYGIVRICSDVPLIVPESIDGLVSVGKSGLYDFVGFGNTVAYPGIGFVLLSALEKVAATPNIPDYYREHVDIGVYQNPNIFRLGTYQEQDPFFIRSEPYRLYIDNYADYFLLEHIHQKLLKTESPDEILDYRKVLEYVDTHRELLDINSRIKQKPVDHKSKKIAMIASVGETIGLGHISRCLTLAQSLQWEFYAKIHFFVQNVTSSIRDKINDYGFVLHEVDDNIDELAKQIIQENYDGAVLDYQPPTPLSLIRKLSFKGIKVMTIDDVSEAMAESDLAVFPVAHASEDELASITTFSKKFCYGNDFVFINQELIWQELIWANLLEKINGNYILITMGGSDPLSLTTQVLSYIQRCNDILKKRRLSIKVIVGENNIHKKEIENIAVKAKNIEILIQPKNFYTLLANADAVIAAFGVTAYELAFLGKPSLLIAHSFANYEAQKRLLKHKFFLDGGFYQKLSLEMFKQKFETLIRDTNIRNVLSKNGKKLVNGYGTSKAAKEFMNIIE